MRFFILLLLLAEIIWAEPASDIPPWEPQPRLAVDKDSPDSEWWDQHQSLLKKARKGNADVLLLGDSITEAWDSAPEVWNAHFGSYTTANFGISGDTTQNLLWRITTGGELSGLSPRLAVLLIGTNNLDQGNNSSADTAHGIATIVAALRTNLPETKILLLGLLPRGSTPETDWRRHIHEVNQAIAALDNGTTITYLDIENRFLDGDGNLLPNALLDGIHPSILGYALWADAMQTEFDRLIKHRVSNLAHNMH